MKSSITVEKFAIFGIAGSRFSRQLVGYVQSALGEQQGGNRVPNTLLLEHIEKYLEEARSLYYRLVLLVGNSKSGKSCALRAMSQRMSAPYINVNLHISGSLLDLSEKQRKVRLPDILRDVTLSGQKTIILDNLELIFDAKLRQDPLRLLQGLARNRTLLVAWAGSYSGGKLTYAELGHPEYRCYDSVDGLVVTMDSTAQMKRYQAGEREIEQ